VTAMGKKKRMIERAAPARERTQDLKAEVARHGVKTIYDLPVDVLIQHRANRLRGVTVE